jgi:predicted nucleic acid-binding protein
VLYVDSSALLKHYIQEVGTDALKARLQEHSRYTPGVLISDIGYAEVLATFARRLRENPLLIAETKRLEAEFQYDWLFRLTRVELDVGVLGFIHDLVRKYPLRGADAIHLASALWLRDTLKLDTKMRLAGGPLIFAASDSQLKNAARNVGLEVFDPEETELAGKP